MQQSFAVPCAPADSLQSPAPALRLDVFLTQCLQEAASSGDAAFSRGRIQQLIEAGHVQVDGQAASRSARVRPGQLVNVVVPEPVALQVTPVPMQLDILHEDNDLVVLNKPAGLVVHPGAGQHGPTLVHGLLAHCHDLSGIGGVLRPGIVHRLDAGTTGVMVVAKNDRAHQHLSAQFAARTTRKRYVTLVHGRPQDARGNPLDHGRIETAFGRHPTHRQRMTGRLPITSDCRMAVTHWRLLGGEDGLSLLEIALETGRTHQIRVHLSELGCPVVGDAMYGAGRPVPEALASTLTHQALHAAQLAFAHPATGVAQVHQAPVPPSWAAMAARLSSL